MAKLELLIGEQQKESLYLYWLLQSFSESYHNEAHYKMHRTITRKEISTTQQAALICNSSLLLHWDGKLLPDITISKELVDRVAVLVAGGDMEQLLAVPKIGHGIGQEQCDACLRALDDWHLKPMVRGLVFDTMASNTGLRIGACTLLE